MKLSQKYIIFYHIKHSGIPVSDNEVEIFFVKQYKDGKAHNSMGFFVR